MKDAPRSQQGLTFPSMDADVSSSDITADIMRLDATPRFNLAGFHFELHGQHKQLSSFFRSLRDNLNETRLPSLRLHHPLPHQKNVKISSSPSAAATAAGEGAGAIITCAVSTASAAASNVTTFALSTATAHLSAAAAHLSAANNRPPSPTQSLSFHRHFQGFLTLPSLPSLPQLPLLLPLIQLLPGLPLLPPLPPASAAAAFAPFAPLASISQSLLSHLQNQQSKPAASRNDLFFARIADTRAAPPSAASSGAAMKKVEYYSVKKVHGDGRCMFRALVLGMAANRGMRLDPDEETSEADELRMAVADALCKNEKRRSAYEEALIAITVEESLKRYCQRIQRSDFWGGESELLVLSRMCSQPIIVYLPESKAREGARWGGGFLPIAEYGSEFLKGSKDRKGRKPVRILYNGSNHYDLLI